MSAYEVVAVDDSDDDGGGNILEMVTSFQLMESPSKSETCERADEHETHCTRNLFKTEMEEIHWSGDESCRPKNGSDSQDEFAS